MKYENSQNIVRKIHNISSFSKMQACLTLKQQRTNLLQDGNHFKYRTVKKKRAATKKMVYSATATTS